MIELYLLEHLCAVYEYKTLSLAAEKLHFTQPSMSRSMQKLENILEVQLFDRQKNRITLNENGVMAAKYAKKILDSEKEMIENIRAFDRRNHTISVGSCAPGPFYLLTPHISSLYPDTNVTTDLETEEDLVQGLKNYSFSLIVLTHEVNEKGIYCAEFFTENLNINLAPSHPMAKRDKLSFEEMDGENFIVYDRIGIWDEIIRSNMPNSRLFTQNDLDAVGEIARSSNLPSFSSNVTVDVLESRRDNRVNVPLDDDAATVTFYLSCLSENKSKFKKLFNSLDKFSIYRR